ncbi:MAG: glycosyltransferase family 39 protein [Chloroflexota bacterium]
MKKVGWIYLFPFLLFVLAFIARSFALARYVTPDELIWVYRSIQFREALLAHDWSGMLVSGHPGVVTMWLGTLGISLQLLLVTSSRDVYVWITHMAWLTPDNTAALQQLAHFLTAVRLCVIFVNSVGIVVFYYLAARLFNRQRGLLAALLLALDPFVAGLSGLLHVDGLMSMFTAVSLLSLALWVSETAVQRKRRFVWAVVTGVTAALAALTKSPAILLVPFTAMFLGLHWLLTAWRQRSFAGTVLRQLLIEGASACWPLLSSACLSFPRFGLILVGCCLLQPVTPTGTWKKLCARRFSWGKLAMNMGRYFIRWCWHFALGPVVFLGLLAGIVLLWQRPFASIQLYPSGYGLSGRCCLSPVFLWRRKV